MRALSPRCTWTYQAMQGNAAIVAISTSEQHVVDVFSCAQMLSGGAHRGSISASAARTRLTAPSSALSAPLSAPSARSLGGVAGADAGAVRRGNEPSEREFQLFKIFWKKI